MSAFLEIRGLSRTYRTVEEGRVTSERTLFRGFDLEVAKGEFIAVVGPSGCGKSTLLNVIGGLDHVARIESALADGNGRPLRPIRTVEGAGEIRIDGFDLAAATGPRRAEFINRNVGFVFQFHHLLPELSALENVMLPVLIRGAAWARARTEAMAILDRVELAGHAAKKPAVLSGGERQRVAIARALVNRPGLVLADEPTGSLDPTLKATTFDLLRELSAEFVITIVMVTHDRSLLFDSQGGRRVSRVIDLGHLGASAHDSSMDKETS